MINEKSLIYNTSFLGEYECSSLALDRIKKKILDHLNKIRQCKSEFSRVLNYGEEGEFVGWFWVEFCGGEEDERELLKMGQVVVVLFGGGEGGEGGRS
ncbi:hypothetical protein Tco_1530974 [Tanacetum coccineum]